MECFIVREEDIDRTRKEFLLRDDEAKHAAGPLRMHIGQALMATTLNGLCLTGAISEIEKSSKQPVVRCSIILELPEHNEPRLNVELAIGVLSNRSYFEEIFEKGTELGGSIFTPMISERSEKTHINRERLTRILQSGCKQSSRARMPQFRELTMFEDALNQARDAGRKVIVLHEGSDIVLPLRTVLVESKANNVTLVIGPEGGFSGSEIETARSKYSATIASLGSRRLRAETAAIAAVSIVISYDQQ